MVRLAAGWSTEVRRGSYECDVRLGKEKGPTEGTTIYAPRDAQSGPIENKITRVANAPAAQLRQKAHSMRLADFILANTELILAEWAVFARSISAGAKMDVLALRDHAEDILRATARDMQSSQSAAQQSDKSKGYGQRGEDSVALNGASEQHAVDRLGSGFDLMEVISEYRALRASVLRLWRDSGRVPDEFDVGDLTRFNESIDQSLSKAASSYTKRVDQLRDLFLAILSHDLRNPLNSISMTAQLLPRLDRLDAESIGGCASQISTNANVMARIIGDLL